MKYETLSFEVVRKVGIIHLLKAPGGIADLELRADEVSDVCAHMQQTGDISVVLIGNVGSEEFAVTADLVSAERARKNFTRLTAEISRLDQPVFAAIPGDCLGMSLEISLACDLRIAGAQSCFGLPQIKSGFMPFAGGTQRLSRVVGKGKALEMILTGDPINAEEALRTGLVNRVVPKEDVLKAAMDMAVETASRGPIALRHAKEAILKGMDLTLDQGLRLEADLYFLIHTTRDRTEGITAFQKKRAPHFVGE